MNYTKIYNNFPYILNQKTSKVVKIWILFLILSFIIFLIIAFNYKYYNYKTYLGYIKKIDNSLHPSFYVREDEVGNLSNYELLIDNEKHSFQIISISNQYYLIDNQPFYEVVIKTNLPDKYLIENNIINLVFKMNQTTLYQEFRKEFNLWKN